MRLILILSFFFPLSAFAQTVNNMTLKNQFGETSINQIVSVSSAGGTTIGTAIPAATVTGKALTGLSVGVGTVSPTDTILQGFNKIAGQTQNRAVTANLLTGLAAGANTTILATDTILEALAKLQAQIDAIP